MSLGYGGLRFDTLRAANINRLPEFKNKKGGIAHTKPDGSDWTVAQWVQALAGELGEFCAVRIKYECGQISREEYEEAAEKELADVATYLDILAYRANDRYEEAIGFEDTSPAQRLMDVLSHLGEYGNMRKKYERGDVDTAEYGSEAITHLTCAEGSLQHLIAKAVNFDEAPDSYAKCIAERGVNLGRAVIEKFNEVSARVKSTFFIRDDGTELIRDNAPGFQYDPDTVKYEEGAGHD